MSLSLQPIDLQKLGWATTNNQDATNAAGFSSSEGNLSIPLNKLTTVNVDGNGAFDVLMKATKLHLKEEYDGGRIVGKEYSTVYLGALTAVLQTAIQHLLNEQQVNQINADIGLIRQKIVTELTLTDDTIPVGLGFNHIFPENTAVEPVVCPEPVLPA